jgi:serine/threonine protein kinase
MFKRDGSLKICDLGFVEVLPSYEDQKLHMVGTRYHACLFFFLLFPVFSSCPILFLIEWALIASRWMAPEVLAGLAYHVAVDIWAVGCIAYEMAQGHLIYEDASTLNCTFTVATIGAPYLTPKYVLL